MLGRCDGADRAAAALIKGRGGGGGGGCGSYLFRRGCRATLEAVNPTRKINDARIPVDIVYTISVFCERCDRWDGFRGYGIGVNAESYICTWYSLKPRHVTYRYFAQCQISVYPGMICRVYDILGVFCDLLYSSKYSTVWARQQEKRLLRRTIVNRTKHC